MSSRQYQVDPTSVARSVAILRDLAALLQAGRPEIRLIEHVRAPDAHEEVAAAVQSFGSRACDQFLNAMALTAALAARADTARGHYVQADAEVAQDMDRLLRSAVFTPPAGQGTH